VARKTSLIAMAVAVAGLLGTASTAGAVVGGRQATVIDNPSMVGLTERGANASEVLFCGGALIAPQVVVTAMHCLSPGTDKAGQIDVVGGALSRSDANLKRAQVAELVRHPAWDDNRTLHDLLVLKLAAPLPLPALAVAGPDDAALSSPGSILRATGWGLTNFKDNDSQPDALKEADIPVVADSVCSAYFGEAIYDDTFQLCGKSATGKPDTCQGDSGGPLIGGAAGSERLVGVVSYGPTSCGAKGGAAVYADVASERSFILGAAGLPDTAPAPTAPTPAPIAPPAAKNTVKLRFGAISCSATTCKLTIRSSGTGNAAITDVILRVTRKGQDDLPPAKRFARAKKVGAGIYSAKTLLPYGVLQISAVAYDATGAQLGKPARETIEVE
jgi:secreted trypsin-like serine protease